VAAAAAAVSNLNNSTNTDHDDDASCQTDDDNYESMINTSYDDHDDCDLGNDIDDDSHCATCGVRYTSLNLATNIQKNSVGHEDYHQRHASDTPLPGPAAGLNKYSKRYIKLCLTGRFSSQQMNEVWELSNATKDQPIIPEELKTPKGVIRSASMRFHPPSPPLALSPPSSCRR